MSYLSKLEGRNLGNLNVYMFKEQNYIYTLVGCPSSFSFESRTTGLVVVWSFSSTVALVLTMGNLSVVLAEIRESGVSINLT